MSDKSLRYSQLHWGRQVHLNLRTENWTAEALLIFTIASGQQGVMKDEACIEIILVVLTYF